LDFDLLAKISFPTAEFSCWERETSPTALVLAVENILWGTFEGKFLERIFNQNCEKNFIEKRF
jgi:hypothetical protein